MGSLIRQNGGTNVTSYNACVRSPSLLLPPGLLPCFPVALPLCSSVSRFSDACRAGELFAVLGNRLCASGLSLARPEIKRRFLADVLAKRKANANGAEYPSAVEVAFRLEFPGVWRFIRVVNRDGWEHWRLIRVLQRLESWLVIDQVCQRFMSRQPTEFIITLHDALFVRPAAVERVIETFNEVFDELDFRMTLKLE